MTHQIRKWWSMFYVVMHCSARGCERRWKSSYFQSRAEAESYAAGLKTRLRCLAHGRKHARTGEVRP